MQKQHGEANSVDPDIIISWRLKLEDYLQNVEPENVFNGDEMGQFWRLMPSKS